MHTLAPASPSTTWPRVRRASNLRLRAAVVTAAFGLLTLLALLIPSTAQAAGYSFYQGCGGIAGSVRVYDVTGTWSTLHCGRTKYGALQVKAQPGNSQVVNTGGTTRCYSTTITVTLKSSGSSGYAKSSCP